MDLLYSQGLPQGNCCAYRTLLPVGSNNYDFSHLAELLTQNPDTFRMDSVVIGNQYFHNIYLPIQFNMEGSSSQMEDVKRGD